LEPDSGVVDIGTTVHIGYFDQYSSDLMTAADEQLRAIDYLKEVGEYIKTADGTQITASQMLEKFLFTGNQQYAPIHMLSGGEKRRLYLLRVLVGAPNLLILDEPTNDLDIQTLSILEDYLTEFPGCVLVVSHDRYFLDRTVEKILALEGDGEIKEYPGNYSVYLDYQKQAESDAKAAKSPPKNSPKAQPPAATSTNKKSLSAWEKRDLGTLEAKITKFEADKASLEAMMATASYGDLPPLTQQLQDLERAIETTTTKWMALAERDS
jgi:ATP-binding cassette subfamily F protein uup